MNQTKSNQGINVNAITFDEHGEMVILDNETLELISGGAGKPKPTPTPTPVPPGGDLNLICPKINISCAPEKKQNN